MTYESISEMLASTENMTMLRNSRNDDSTDTFAGVDWFKFKGITATNAYVSGNGWFNFGNSSEGGLKVNRRDQVVYNIWREEGCIHNEFNKFLRFRWRGYSRYNMASDDRLLDFDVVLLNTGDIILRITTWPTTNCDGYNRLEAQTNINFSPSQSSKEFMFLHQDEEGYNFSLYTGIYEVFLPAYFVTFHSNGGYGNILTQRVYCGESTALLENTFIKFGYEFIGWDTSDDADTIVYTDGQTITDIADEDETVNLYAVWRKTWAWLIGDSAGKIYTVSQTGGVQTRTELTGVTTLTAQLFYEQGFQFTPDSSVLIDISSPRVYKWNKEESPALYAVVDGVPLVPQLVVFDTMIVDSAVKYINIAGDSDTLWNVSFDGGTTWWKYNDGWVQVSATGDGCLKRKLEILTATDWAAKMDGTLKFRCWLRRNGWVSRIRVDL